MKKEDVLEIAKRVSAQREIVSSLSMMNTAGLSKEGQLDQASRYRFECDVLSELEKEYRAAFDIYNAKSPRR